MQHGKDILFKETRPRFDSVRLEHRHHEVIPDIIATKRDREVLIEILVTHACDERKISILNERVLPTVEIDLSGLRTCDDLVALDRAILETAERHWIFHPLIAEREEQRRSAEEHRLTIVANNLLARLRPLRANAGEAGKLTTSLLNLRQCGLEHLVGIELEGGWITGASGQVWQAELLWTLVSKGRHRYDTLQVSEVVKTLHSRRPFVMGLVGMAQSLTKLIRERHADFVSPEVLAASYIAVLAEQGFLNAHAQFQPQVIASALHAREQAIANETLKEKQRRRERAAAELEAQRLQARKEEEGRMASDRIRIEDEIEWLLRDLDQADRKTLNLAEWWKSPLANGRTPNDVLRDRFAAESLWQRIRDLSDLFTAGSKPATDLMNLPLASVQSLRTAEQAEKQAAHERELVEYRQLEVVGLSEHLQDFPGWIDTPQRELDGLSPRQFAADTSKALGTVFDLANGLLRYQREARQWKIESEARASRFNAALNRAAEYIYGLRAALWLDTTNPRLGGQPRAVCQDSRSFDRCVDALEKDGRKKLPSKFRQA